MSRWICGWDAAQGLARGGRVLPVGPSLASPYLQGGQEGGQVGELLLEGLVLLFILAAEGRAARSPKGRAAHPLLGAWGQDRVSSLFPLAGLPLVEGQGRGRAGLGCTYLCTACSSRAFLSASLSWERGGC